MAISIETTVDGKLTTLPVLAHRGLPCVVCTQILTSTLDAARLAWGDKALHGFPGEHTAPEGRQLVGYVAAYARGPFLPVTVPDGEPVPPLVRGYKPPFAALSRFDPSSDEVARGRAAKARTQGTTEEG